MAYRITDSGVRMTRGRGGNAVALDITFAEIDRWARRMKVDEESLFSRSYGRAIKGLKDKFVQVMRAGGGVNGVPKFRDFEDFTKELRANRGRTAPMGGLLADRSTIFISMRGKGRAIGGWKDYLEKPARNFQDGVGGSQAEKWFTEPGLRREWHRMGLKRIPSAYVHNPRPVIEPYFMDFIRANLESWARGAFYKDLARRMAKAGDIKA